jgi:hypothetical protein
MAQAWPDIVRRYKELTGFLGLGSALDGLRPTINDATVELVGRLPEGQVRLALSWSRALVPTRPLLDGGLAP